MPGLQDTRRGILQTQINRCTSNVIPSVEPSDQIFGTMQTVFAGGDVGGTPETMVGPMPVVSFDQAGSPSLLKPIQAFRWFIDCGGRHGTLWENRVTRVN